VWQGQQEQRDVGSLALKGCAEASLTRKTAETGWCDLQRGGADTRQRCRMGGEVIGMHGVEGESKETAVLLLWEDERRPSWSLGCQKMRGEEESLKRVQLRPAKI
jgi:predicted alpha/beta-fold hydrolase